MKKFFTKKWVKIIIVILVLGGIGGIMEQFEKDKVSDTNIINKDKTKKIETQLPENTKKQIYYIDSQANNIASDKTFEKYKDYTTVEEMQSIAFERDEYFTKIKEENIKKLLKETNIKYETYNENKFSIMAEGIEKKWEKAETKDERMKNSYKKLEYVMRVMCEKAIKKQLKTPSSAKFNLKYGFNKVIGKYQVKIGGTVDSQNSFGAMLRYKVLCKFNYIDEDKDFKIISSEVF